MKDSAENNEPQTTLCWELVIDGNIHQYEMAFGYFDGEATAVVFVTLIDSEGGEASKTPVAFLPADVMALAIADGWDEELT